MKKYIKKITLILLVLVFLLSPMMVSALEMPSAQNMADEIGFTAKAYLAIDKSDDKVLISKNTDLPWTAASLTKLVTVMVFLDTKPNLKRVFAMQKRDELGGARIATAAGVAYKLNDLLHASLIASANNATHALARSTGLTDVEFVKRMNAKAKELGAEHSVFYEVSGMDPRNTVTASDYAKIAAAAFANPVISKITSIQTYTFRSTNYTRYAHTVKNTDKLLGDSEFLVLGGKTGYLEESLYNFATQLRDRFGNNLVIVLLGSKNSTTQFKETKELANLAGLAKSFGGTPAMVLGTSTQTSLQASAFNQ